MRDIHREWTQFRDLMIAASKRDSDSQIVLFSRDIIPQNYSNQKSLWDCGVFTLTNLAYLTGLTIPGAVDPCQSSVAIGNLNGLRISYEVRNYFVNDVYNRLGKTIYELNLFTTKKSSEFDFFYLRDFLPESAPEYYTQSYLEKNLPAEIEISRDIINESLIATEKYLFQYVNPHVIL